jgi:hypothetical protein
VISVHILCLDDCFATTIMPQPTEITQFIFGQPLRALPLFLAERSGPRGALTLSAFPPSYPPNLGIASIYI